MRALRIIWLAAVLLLRVLTSGAQIVNRLNVDPDTFQRYAWGRMQQYNPDNLPLADSLYSEGLRKDNVRLRCLGLALEYPVRFATGEYARMDAAVAEIKELIGHRKDCRSFYYAVLHEYCQFLVHIGRSSDAMLEARAMERLSNEEKKPLGKMYAYRIVGLIHSYRDNHHLAVKNLTNAVRYCKESRTEQDLPQIYLLIARECIKMRDFRRALEYCTLASEFQQFYSSVQLRVTMTLAYYYYASGQEEEFQECYGRLKRDPVFRHLSDTDSRLELDIFDLRLRNLPDLAIIKADSLSTPIGRYSQRHGLYAQVGRYSDAYNQLDSLMVQKDSVYIRVQNEDLAILDAEMNNAQLREEAQQLRLQNDMALMGGFLVMFLLVFIFMIVQQWRLSDNLSQLRAMNDAQLMERKAFQTALNAKEAENALRIKLLQKRKFNTLQL